MFLGSNQISDYFFVPQFSSSPPHYSGSYCYFKPSHLLLLPEPLDDLACILYQD